MPATTEEEAPCIILIEHSFNKSLRFPSGQVKRNVAPTSDRARPLLPGTAGQGCLQKRPEVASAALVVRTAESVLHQTLERKRKPQAQGPMRNGRHCKSTIRDTS
jgi:hypothetical protein